MTWSWTKLMSVTNKKMYGEQELLQHKKMWDIVTRDKAGRAKEQSFSEWCRRVASHPETSSTARGHVEADSTATEHAEADSTATEHAELSASFRALAEDILTNDLTEVQIKKPCTSFAKAKPSRRDSAARSTPSCERTWEIPESAISYSTMAFLHCWMYLSVKKNTH